MRRCKILKWNRVFSMGCMSENDNLRGFRFSYFTGRGLDRGADAADAVGMFKILFIRNNVPNILPIVQFLA
jgi:hypothetical protein